jgi:hypothetical protein
LKKFIVASQKLIALQRIDRASQKNDARLESSMACQKVAALY